MSRKFATLTGSMLITACAAFSTGCIGVHGPSLGPFSIPIPVSPYFQDGKSGTFTIMSVMLVYQSWVL